MEYSNFAQEKVLALTEKLIDIVDKRLSQHNSNNNFEFQFTTNTPPNVVENVCQTYKFFGWKVDSSYDKSKNAFILEFIMPKDKVSTKNNAFGPNFSSLFLKESGDLRESVIKAFKDPILTNLSYQSVLRKIIFVDETPWDKTLKYVQNKKSIKPVRINKKFKLDMPKLTTKDSLNDLAVEISHNICDFEKELLINNVYNKNIKSTCGINNLNQEILNSYIHFGNMSVLGSKIVTNNYIFYKHFCQDKMDDKFNMASQRDILMSGLCGNYINSDIYIITHEEFNKQNRLIVSASAKFCGALRFNGDNDLKITEFNEESIEIEYTADLAVDETSDYIYGIQVTC